MNSIKCNKLVVLFAAAASLMSHIVSADWQLNNDASTLNFISTKNEHISEIHSFTSLSGELSKGGNLSVNVDLSSVNTNIAIRDERMQEHLFEVKAYPVAMLSATIDEEVLSIAKGHSVITTISAKITISGMTQSQNILVRVTKDSHGGLIATTMQPFIIHVPAFNLAEGINKLKELAGLNSISLAIPVTFSVTFEHK